MELDRPDATAATIIRDRPEPHFEPDPGRGRGGLGLAIAAALALAVAGGAGLWYLAQQRETVVEPSPETSPVAPGAEAVELSAAVAPDAALPSLDESDELVARLALGLSSHPQLERWLGVGSIVRRVVVAVDNIAEGVSPRNHLAFLAPQSGFTVIESPNGPVQSPESMARYDLPAEVFASIDTGAVARLYGRLKPLFIEAWRDLGHPDGQFDRRLLAAIDRLLATPTPAEAPLLVAKVSSYEYADPNLESLSAAQKHLLRMGPSNAEKVKAGLRELRSALLAR